MTVRDAAGNVLFTLTASGGRLPPTGEVFLNAGSYTVSYTAWDTAGATAIAIPYSAFIQIVTDPIGMYMPPLTDTTTATTAPPPASPPPTAPAPPPTIAYTTTGIVLPVLVSYPFFF